MATPETLRDEWDPDQIDTDEMILNMGPQHPATHGVLRLELRTDGEIVKAARPHIGYLHRCFEKHAETIDYPGVMPYTDRMDYCAAMGNTLGFALAVEKLSGIEVSPYVATVRVIMAELQRIASHAVAVGTYTMDIGAFTPFLHLLRDREKILDLFEWTCGARLLYNYNWVGGVSHDLPDGFVRATRDFLREFDAVTYPELLDLIIGNKIFIKRLADVGVCSPELAISYDLTGPNLRGSGLARDLRKDEPYLGYETLRLRGLPWARASTGRSAPASTATGCASSRCARARRSSTRRSTGSRRWRRRTSTRRCRSASSRRRARSTCAARRRAASSATTSSPTGTSTRTGSR